jgi:L-aspartate oxidase
MTSRIDSGDVRSTDVVIVGGGVAGLTAALHATSRRIRLVTSRPWAAGGSSVHAQGGVAAALAPEDTPKAHAADTLAAGAGLCHDDVVRRVTDEGPGLLRWLLDRGANFDRGGDGELALGLEGAHSRPRVAHAAGDGTGREMVRALAAAVAGREGVTIDQEVLALELVLDRGRVAGLMAVDRHGCKLLYDAPEVVIATGGCGQLWRATTNPTESTGGGLVLAGRAGARLANLEMVQFHPTALATGGRPLALLSEALRGDGAVLIDSRGQRFMTDEHPLAELAPRDVVARAIWRRMAAGEAVRLDATGLAGDFERRFPTVVGLARDRGFDPLHVALPVTPAAHYHMGGIVTDGDGRSSVPGLWACGEVAFTGLHGANRLASNSLLEALVYGAAVGRGLARTIGPRAHPVRFRRAASGFDAPAVTPWLDDDPEAATIADLVGEIMWRDAGLERDAAGLRRAAWDLVELGRRLAPGVSEVRSMVELARLVVASAASRTESRGAHFRRDIPWPSDSWRQDTLVENGRGLEPRPMVAAAL